MKRRLALLIAALTLASGCAAAGGVPATSDTPRRDLAETPASLTPTPTGHGPLAHRTPAGSSSPGSASPTAQPSIAPTADITASADGTSGGPTTQPAGSFRTFATLPDGANDGGLDAPAYGDLRGVTLAGNAHDLQVTVTVRGAFPSRLSDTETMGIGVDFYRPQQHRESDYQLFVDGEPDGWFAYLDTPRGFVQYPGTFALGGTRLIFTVPLSSIGSPTRGRFSAFIDWSRKKSGLTGNKASNDYAPTLGTKTYARS